MTADRLNLPSQYDPAQAESRWQHLWETQAAFQADVTAEGPVYCVVIPPPNVTGSLHMGHAFESALIDVLVRYHRMRIVIMVNLIQGANAHDEFSGHQP